MGMKYSESPVKRDAGAAALVTLQSAVFPETTIHAREFGVIEDGAADNSSALLAMRAHLRKNMTRLHNIHFDGGHVKYTDNQWLKNIGPVRIFANGTIFECTSAALGADRATRTFDNSTFYFSEGDSRSAAPAERYPIASASAFDTSITFVDEGAASAFSVGEPIFLCGFDHQFGGFPPNPRYFEWPVITAVDLMTNSVQLRERLIFDYDQDWPELDDEYGFGPPAVLKLRNAPAETSGFYFNPYIEIRDAVLLNSRATEYVNGITLAADTLILENVTVDGELWPSMNRLFYGGHLQVAGTVEVDKNIDRCTLVDVYADEWLKFGSGAHFVDVQGGRYSRAYISAKTFSLRQVTLLADDEDPYGIVRGHAFPVHSLSVEQCALVARDSQVHMINNMPALSFEASIEDTTGVIHLADDEAARLIIGAIDVGFVVKRASPSESAILLRIGWDADNSRWKLFFAGDGFTGTIAADEEFTFNNPQRIRYRQNRKLGAPGTPAFMYDRPDQVDTDDDTYSE